MEKLFERLNLYDILAMICPGGLLLLAIMSTGEMWGGVKAIPWIQHIMKQTILTQAFCFGCLGLLFSYLLGIVIHTLVTIWGATIGVLAGVWKLVLWICYKFEIEKSTDEISDKKIFSLLNEPSPCTIKIKKLQYEYFKAHSYARKMKGTVLSTIEQQVAMLRNTIIPCVWLMVLALSQLDMTNCQIGWIVLGYWVACGIIIWAREYKLFAIVLLTYNLEETN